MPEATIEFKAGMILVLGDGSIRLKDIVLLYALSSDPICPSFATQHSVLPKRVRPRFFAYVDEPS